MISIFHKGKKRGSRAKPSLHSRSPRLEVENLETRIQPAVRTNLSGGILSITADDAFNRVRVAQPSPTQVQVLESDQPVGTFTANQVQLVVFQYGAAPGTTFQNDTSIFAKRLRLFNSARLSPDQLRERGSLDALLIGNTLSLTGSSGAGFQVQGSWTATTEQVGTQSRHVFTASGTMTLKTALGDLHFVASAQAPFTIRTDSVLQLRPGFGSVAQVTWSSAGLLNTTTANSPLRRFQEQFGLQLTSGSTTLDVKLGHQLATFPAPLNNALPYIYLTTTSAQAQFGTMTAQVGPSNPLQLAFDPQDPSLYARVNEFSVAGSLKGYIPFTPTRPLQTNPLFGHLYGRGTVTLTVGTLPVTAAGEAVLDLDAQRDGRLLSRLSGTAARDLLTNRTSLSTFANAAPNDLRVGINGTTQLAYRVGGFDLSLPVAASAVYAADRLSVNGQATVTTTLFQNTPLRFLVPSVALAVTADLGPQGHVDIRATASAATAASWAVTDLRVELTNTRVRVEATANLLGIGHVRFSGNVRAGSFYTLEARATSLTVAGFSLGAADLYLSNDPLIGVGISIGFVAPTLPVLGRVEFEGAYFSGGRFDFQVMVPGPILIGGIPFQNLTGRLTESSLTVGAGIGISLPGFSVGLASFTGTIHTNGDFNLRAQTADVQVLGFSVASAELRLEKAGSQTNLKLEAQANFLVTTVRVTGDIRFAQREFEFRGTANIGVAGFTLSNTHFVATNVGGLRVELHSTTNILHVGTVNFDGTLTKLGSSYVIDVRARGTFAVAGFALASAELALTNTKLSVSGQLTISVLGVRAFLSGEIRADGWFSLATGADLNLGPLSGGIHFTLNNSGFWVGAFVQLDLTTRINFWIGDLTVGFRINASANFRLNFDGSFVGAGSFTARALFGVSVSLTIGLGFQLTNHGVVLLTSKIGFSVWGISFHPFNDVAHRVVPVVPDPLATVFVAHAYLDLLHRPVDPVGLHFVTAQLNQGRTRTEVAVGLIASPEYRQNLVVGYYQKYLGRTPSTDEINSWLDDLQSGCLRPVGGCTQEEVQMSFVSSPEYYARQGSTNRQFVSGLYREVLGRTGAEEEITHWMTVLDGFMRLGATPEQARYHVASAFLNGSEYRANLIQRYYSTFLGRAASAAEVSWRNGQRSELALAEIIGSEEYRSRLR